MNLQRIGRYEIKRELGLLTGLTMHWMFNRPTAHHIRLRLTSGPTA